MTALAPDVMAQARPTTKWTVLALDPQYYEMVWGRDPEETSVLCITVTSIPPDERVMHDCLLAMSTFWKTVTVPTIMVLDTRNWSGVPASSVFHQFVKMSEDLRPEYEGKLKFTSILLTPWIVGFLKIGLGFYTPVRPLGVLSNGVGCLDEPTSTGFM
jgi:hypothetical protein